MSLPDFLRFTPVPVRARRDGWTPELQFRFILNLARGMGPGEAARRLGRTRQTAYALRGKPGGEQFAAAWDKAASFSTDVDSAQMSKPLEVGRFPTLLVPRYYRGRLIGFTQREDLTGVMRKLELMDRVAARLDRAQQEEGHALLMAIIGDGTDAETDKSDGNIWRTGQLRQFSDASAPLDGRGRNS